MDINTPSEGAKKEAKNHPNGYVYAIDPAFDKKDEDVPVSAILGAWKVNEHGDIIGEFIKNPYYLDLKKL